MRLVAQPTGDRNLGERLPRCPHQRACTLDEARRESLNQKLFDVAALGALDASARVSKARLLDFSWPIYDGDWEAEHGLPRRA